MTTTPGGKPGSSDSSEPDHGDSPTPPTASPSSDAPASNAPRIPQPSAPADAAQARTEPEDEQRPAAASPPGWAQHQPPPAEGGWARWTPPQGAAKPPAPQPQAQQQHQGPGGPRWGPSAGGPRPGAPVAGGWQPHPVAWGTQAPAPKPGVLPLRPVGFSEILDGAIATLRLHWRKVIGFTVAIGLVTEAVTAVLEHQFSDTSSLDDLQDNPDPTATDIVHAMGGSMAATGLTLLITMFASVIATALIATVVSRAVLGRQVTAAELRRDARERLPHLLGLAVLMPLITCLTVGVGALPGILISVAGAKEAGAALGILGGFAGALVMIWLYIQLSLTAPALMLEKQGVVASMKRSWKLVTGAWWRVLGIQLLALILVTIVTSIIALPFLLVGDAVAGDGSSGFFSTGATSSWTYLVILGVGGTIGTAVTLPITAGCTTLLYLDQRIRRESLDIELIGAAREAAREG
jgi:ethanolamine utilization microcompartment shell protein EutS